MRKSSILLSVVAMCIAVAFPLAATAQDTETDLALFSTTVSPNVVIVLDNSGSMDAVVWHPDFDPTAATPACNVFNVNSNYVIGAGVNGGFFTFCGRTRWVYNDTAQTNQTLWNGRYLNWYFQPTSDAAATDVTTLTATRVCDGTTFSRYERSRMTAAKQVVMDTICELDASRDVRIGLAIFRVEDDPEGGYLRVGAADPTTAQFAALENAVSLANANSWTPLGETLFQVYTYFMTRDDSDIIDGADGSTEFPVYEYVTSNGGVGGLHSSSGSGVPPSPVQYECQKNFVVIITDGEPTRDDFDGGGNEDQGFDDFDELIGDFNADGEVEEPGDGNETGRYLDDIAKFMAETDFDDDLPGDQLVDVYTIGFTTNGAANDLLAKTATQGNGIFFTSNSAEELTAAITGAITNILEKTQSFTAATVPSARAEDGGSFFTSFFLPSAKRALWEGHVRAFSINAVGDILDSSGLCALDDPTAGECNSGPFLTSATPWWDTALTMPAENARILYTSELLGAGISGRKNFDQSSITHDDLLITDFAAAPAPAPNPLYLGSEALNEEGLADEVVSYVRGCDFATGIAGADFANDVACDPRIPMLGDVFHSSPIIVPKPRRLWPDASYIGFKNTYANRDRILYVGANDGFLHAFHAGDWQAALTPPKYDAGSGTEVFGFMPYEARQNVKNLYVDSPDARTHYVDASPQAADVWFHGSPTQTNKASNEWRTVLVGGMRDGGESFFALDITDPTSSSYPGYMWEFPREDDANTSTDPRSFAPFMGKSWGQPIITRIRVAVGTDDNSGMGYERWVAIMTGGYHAESDPNDAVNYDINSNEGRAIVMVDIQTGEVLAAQRYNAGATDATADMQYAITSTPSVLDIDADGFADVIYVGDLGGQVFKWVVSGVGADRVNDGMGSSGIYSQPNWDFSLFFQAPVENVAGTNRYKAFYFPPSAAKYGSTLWISMGSGERRNLNYAGDSSYDENNRYYVVKDTDPENNLGVPATLFETNLTDVTASAACASIANQGYFFTVPDGEKFVTKSDIFAGLVFVASYTPPVSTNPCNATGTAALYIFSLSCGEGYFPDGADVTRKLDLDIALPTDPQVSVGPDGKDSRIYIELSNAELESVGAPDIDVPVQSLYWRMLD